MIYNNKTILKKYKNKYYLNKAIDNKEIYRIGHGLYSDSLLVNQMVITSKKHPNSILTMDSAFYYYNLTDIIPDKTYIATNRNSNTIKDNNIVQIWVDKTKLNEGKEQVTIDNEIVNIYNKERLLIELIRKRNQMSFDYYKEIINNYRKIAEELDMYKIEEYLHLYKNEANLGNIILREVF